MKNISPLKSAAEIALSPARKKVSSVEANWYDASRFSPSRMFVWQPVQPARRDLDRYTRFELNKRGEYLWKNSPLIRGMIERLVNLTIGTGIYPTFKSSSVDFNLAAKKFWKRICRRPCLDSKMSMGQFQRIKIRQRFVHGEGFTLLTHSDRFNCDAIQGLEWHRIAGASQSNPGVVNYGSAPAASAGGDGITKDEQGFPVSYQINDVDPVTQKLKDPTPEQFMVHHFTPKRDEQDRGETILAAGINTAQDVKEILEYEKQAVKDSSSRLDIIQTMTGDLDPETFRKSAFGVNFPPVGAVANDKTTKDAYYKQSFGVAPVVLKTGDKYTPYIPTRPGNAWEGFMAFLANTIVLGSDGFPPSLVIPVDIGGTDIRRDLQIGQKIIESWQADEAQCQQAICEYFLQGGIEDRELPAPPKDWREIEWHFTGSLTVDRNKDQVRLALVEAGLMTWDEYFGESGADGDEQEQKMIDEVRRRRFRITGKAMNAPFENASEFKQFLSFSEQTKVSETYTETAPTAGDPTPGKKKNLQNA